MLNKRRSFGARKVSPPQPTCMSEIQKATYLQDLRENRPARPAGSRPLPSKPTPSSSLQVETTPVPVPSALHRILDNDGSASSKRHSLPAAATFSSTKGRPLVQAPDDTRTTRRVTPPEIKYRESTARALEKKEAHFLRKALEERDFQDDESRVYQAAQLEAADLVWKHRNPELADQEIAAPYRNPDLPKKGTSRLTNASTDHLGRIQEQLPAPDTVAPLKVFKRSSEDATQARSSTAQNARRRSSGTRKASSGSSKGVFRNPEDQIYEEPTEVEIAADVQRSDKTPLQSTTAHNSLRGARPLPGKPQANAFHDPSRLDRVDIYKNPPSQSRDAAYRVNHASRSGTPEDANTSNSQAIEIRSDDIRAATSMRRSDRSPKLPTPTAVSDRVGRPIVSFDPSWRPEVIGQRKSLDTERPSSRSSPMKSSVTAHDNLNDVRSSLRSPAGRSSTQFMTRETRPMSAQSNNNIPIINVSVDSTSDTKTSRAIPEIQIAESPSAIPQIQISQDAPNEKSDIPSINVIDHNDSVDKAVPAPEITPAQSSKASSRPLPTASSQSKNRVPWLSRGPAVPMPHRGARGPTVSCTACGLPIAGRIVTASGASNNQKARFHPECFSCFHCSTALECVSFYPEPEAARLERLENAEPEGYASGQPRLPSPDETDLRFYCHLDFHDLFSPRCGSCHTPIEGAVILAAGKSWHEGHFFCAECGDPFSSASPFVESRGYAYCVGCHTKRTAARCRGCKKQILDEVSVEALGAKWHDDCFRCDECNGDFGDDGRFFVREVKIELTDKEKRKGVSQCKVEERAVCDMCEQRRLKSPDVVAFL